MADKAGDGGSRSSPMVVSGRKRGHQHHVRNSGTRRSNVPAQEVIAALRAATFANDNDNNNDDNNDNDEDVMQTSTVSTISSASNSSDNNNTNTNPNRSILAELNANMRGNSPTISDLSSNNNNNNNVNRNLPVDSTEQEVSPSDNNNNNNNGDEDVSVCSDLSESTTASSSSKKTRSSGSSKKRSSRKRDSPSSDQRKRRPKGDGQASGSSRGEPGDAQSGDIIIDIENDPEAAEWSKLRCTSERTEVVAEREYRRQNRRCADYPGLAFGRSIFSSDTMMKLNIIRNELHNIMKTQLKRVRLEWDRRGGAACMRIVATSFV